MEMSKLKLGLDLGTTSIKMAVVDERNAVVVSKTQAADANIASDIGDTAFEQDPLKIISTVNDLIQSLQEELLQKICAIAVTGQMHGIMLWTSQKQTKRQKLDCLVDVETSNLFTWQDQRCTPEFLATLPKPSNRRLPVSTGHGCATLFWLSRFCPEYLERFQHCGTVMDFLVFLLCECDGVVTSDQLAASLGYFNQETGNWDEVLTSNSTFAHILPKIVEAGQMVGQVRRSGWPQVPVYVGLGDVQCAMRSHFGLSYSKAAINISTSIQLGFCVPGLSKTEKVKGRKYITPPRHITLLPYFEGHQLAVFAGLNGGEAIKCFVESVASWITTLGFAKDIDVKTLHQKVYDLAVQEKETFSATPSSASPSSSTTAIRSSLIKVKPAFFAERHDTGMSGEMTGLTFSNMKDIHSVYRAVCEGVVEHLHAMVPGSILTDRGIDTILLSGSVAERNVFVADKLKELYHSKGIENYGAGDGLLVELNREEAGGSAVGAAMTIE